VKKKTTAAPRLGRPPATDSADTRQRILDIARIAFAARGYAASTNRSLGADAGITAGAIYHYFGSKLDLYISVHDAVQARVYAKFEDAIVDPPTFRAKIEAVLEEAHEMNKEDPSLAQFLGALRVDMRRNPELKRALQHSANAREAFFNRIVDHGVSTGEIDPAKRSQVSALVLTLLIGLTDAVSGNPNNHRLAVDAIKGLLEGTLLATVD
jgi:AcrR family transcriptional regulator